MICVFPVILCLTFHFDLSAMQSISASLDSSPLVSLFRYVCLKDAGCFECRGALCNAGPSFDTAADCLDSCKSAKKLPAAKSGAICSASTCLPCSNSVCDLGTFFETMDGCEKSCTSAPGIEISYECQLGQCVSCKVGVDCPGEGDGGEVFPDVRDCQKNCVTPRRQKPKTKYMCQSDGKCKKCTKGTTCPQDVPLFGKNSGCKKKCKKSQYFCQPGGLGCTECDGGTAVKCPTDKKLEADLQTCNANCKTAFACPAEGSSTCTRCSTGLDCGSGATYDTENLCKSSCNAMVDDPNTKYRCLSNGNCQKCSLGKNCPADVPLHDDSGECSMNCTKTQFFCLPGGKGCKACGGATSLYCAPGDSLYKDSKSCGKICKPKYYCAEAIKSNCTQCSAGLDCPAGATYDNTAKCKKVCKPKEVFYCEYAGKCTKCGVGADCPDMPGLYDLVGTCKAVCKARTAKERQYFCDMTLQQCRECTAKCPAVTFKNAAACKSADCPTTTKDGLWTCTGNGQCSPCKLDTGCGLGLGPDGKEITDVCDYMPYCSEFSVFNSKYKCEKECFRNLCDNLPNVIYENRTETIEYDYWYYWNYCLPARPLLKQEYCNKPQIHNALKYIPDQLKYEVGDYVQVECEPHHRLTGSELMQCFTGGVWWPQPYCKHVEYPSNLL